MNSTLVSHVLAEQSVEDGGRPWRKTIKWKIEIALVRRDWLLGTLRGHYVLLDVNCNPFTP